VSGCGVNFEKRTNIISPQIYYVVSKQANNIMLYGCKPSEMPFFLEKERKKEAESDKCSQSTVFTG
jgi:hypothetical protein